MEKDTKKKNEIEVEKSTPYYEGDDENYKDDTYNIDDYLKGNMKDDPGSVRSRPRSIPVSKLQITDEDKIPKMPERIIPMPDEKAFKSKIDALNAESQKKKESINQLIKKKQEESYGFKSDDKENIFMLHKELRAKAYELRNKIKEDAGGVSGEAKKEINELKAEIKKFDRFKFSTNPQQVDEEIKSIQEKLSFSDLTANEEKKLGDRKAQLEEYATILKKFKEVKEKNKEPLDKFGKEKKELKEIYEKLDAVNIKIDAVKSKNQDTKPIINQINFQIDELKKERQKISEQNRLIREENNNAWYEYEQQQKLIDYINRANDKIKNMKKRIEKEKKRKEKMEKDGKEEAGEDEVKEIVAVIPKVKIYDTQIKECETLGEYFKNLLPKKEPLKELQKEIVSEKTKLDEDISKGFIKEINKQQNESALEIGLSQGSKKKKGKGPKVSKRELKNNGLTLDFEIINKLKKISLSPPGKRDDIPMFLVELEKKKEYYMKENIEVSQKSEEVESTKAGDAAQENK